MIRVSVEWKIAPGGVNKSCPHPLRPAGKTIKCHGVGAEDYRRTVGRMKHSTEEC